MRHDGESVLPVITVLVSVVFSFAILPGVAWQQYLETIKLVCRKPNYFAVLSSENDALVENVFVVAADLPGAFAGSRGVGAHILRS